jgi:hypothetical protein
MMKTMMMAVMLIGCATAAFSAEPPKAAKASSLTVAQVTGVGQALRRLTYYVSVGKEGQIANVPYGPDRPTPYRFGGDVMFAMSVDLQQSDIVLKAYQDAHAALIKQHYGSADKLPKEGEPDPKREAFLADMDKAFTAPSSALMVRIKREDLCLDVTPKCPQANPIPLDVLMLLLPIVDQ